MSRRRSRRRTGSGRASGSAASTGRCSRSSARSGPALAWLVVVVQDAPTRYAGLGWLAAGSSAYLVYRRGSACRGRDARSCARRSMLGPAIALEYRNILVPVVAGPRGRGGDRPRGRLAAERGATIVALRVVVVPLDLPIDADCPRRRSSARRRLLDDAAAIAELYGVDVSRAPRPGPARRPRDRRGGRAAPERDRRPGRAAPSGRCRSSATPSTTSSSTPRAA